MKKSRLWFLGLLLLFLVLVSSLVESVEARPRMCWSKCRQRCKKAKVKGKCFNNCNVCCGKCKCVPALGHIHQCPCYRHMKKCP
ncbi:hypothetical protein V2J09_024076 [Rumex salicifolius]